MWKVEGKKYGTAFRSVCQISKSRLGFYVQNSQADAHLLNHLNEAPQHSRSLMRFLTQEKVSPVVDVIVLAAPSPVLVGKAVDFEELLFAKAGDATKIAGVW